MLKGKCALVTGGSRGIGRAVALKLAECGADVAILCTKESESAKNTVREIEAAGSRALMLVADISDETAVADATKNALDAFGKIDILVNNAGITRDRLLMQMTGEDFDSVISVNLKGCFNVTKALIRQFVKNRSGRIINISSVVGLMGNAGQANYAASKAGVIGFTKSVAKEYAARGITCNAIAPGYIETDMTGAMPDEAKKTMLDAIPAKRGGTPEDVANLAAFLASDLSSYITGEVIRVDGGMYI